MIVRIMPGAKVHSILDDGTWLRVESTNREMNAAEITRAPRSRRHPAAARGCDRPS
jgi:hypothetical protein